MVDAEYLNRIVNHAIWHNIWCVRDHKFARSRNSPRSSHLEIGWKECLDVFNDVQRYTMRGRRIIEFNKFAQRREIVDCFR